MMPFVRLLQSPANWVGLAAATVALVAQAVGWTPWGGWWLPPLAYALGFGATGLLAGWPRLGPRAWEALEFTPGEVAGEDLATALARIEVVATRDTPDHLTSSLQAATLDLCTRLRHLLLQWERNPQALSPEDSFHARQIVLRYLPDALKAYLAVPPGYARTESLANGLTAEETLHTALRDLSGTVQRLTRDLAAQDADALVGHARFLQHKFGTASHTMDDRKP